MARKTIPLDRYIEAAQVFHWATNEHFILWFMGVLVRHRRTESVLRKLVQKGRLRSVRFGKRLIYTVPRRTKGKQPTITLEKSEYEPGLNEKAIAGRNKIVHGLACTECLVRFWRSSMDGEIIAERFSINAVRFRNGGLGIQTEKCFYLSFVRRAILNFQTI